MKKLCVPTRPYVPYKPEPPSETIPSRPVRTPFNSCSTEFSLADLQSAIDSLELPSEISRDSVQVEVSYSSGYYDSIDIEMHLVYCADIPNPYYQKQLKQYEQNLIKFKAENEKYKQDSATYKVKLAEYELALIPLAVIDAEKRVAIAEKNLQIAREKAEKLAKPKKEKS